MMPDRQQLRRGDLLRLVLRNWVVLQLMLLVIILVVVTIPPSVPLMVRTLTWSVGHAELIVMTAAAAPASSSVMGTVPPG